MAITLKRGAYSADSKWVETVETIAEGAVLKVWRDSIQVMSDIWETTTYATYWDQTQERLLTVPWVTEGKVDATPEVLAQVEAFLYSRAYEDVIQKAQNQAAVIRKGAKVKVVKGRQDKGAVGLVVVDILRPYQMGWKASQRQKVGIATSDVKVKVAAANGKVYENYKDITWAWAHNCELVEVPQVDLQEVKEIAREKAKYEYQRVYKAA
jgi:hypothetical protein